MKTAKLLTTIVVLLIALAVSIVLVITVGSAKVPLSHVIDILKYRVLNIGEKEAGWAMSEFHIVWNIRMPRILLSIVAGAGLAICGAVMQAVVLNPIADPFILGVSSGASAGAACALIMPMTFIPLTANVTAMAFLGAIVSSVAVYLLARAGGGGTLSPVALILSGTAISALMGAVTNLFIFFAKSAESIASVYYWQMGSISSADWRSLPVPAAITGLGAIALICSAEKLNILMMGEEDAMALGLNVKGFRLLMMGIVSLIVSALVSETGIIGFVGLMIPQIVRMLTKSSNNKVILPISLCAGALFMVWADTFARSLLKVEIPLGIITAFTGTPFFVFLMAKRKKLMGGL